MKRVEFVLPEDEAKRITRQARALGISRQVFIRLALNRQKAWTYVPPEQLAALSEAAGALAGQTAAAVQALGRAGAREKADELLAVWRDFQRLLRGLKSGEAPEWLSFG